MKKLYYNVDKNGHCLEACPFKEANNFSGLRETYTRIGSGNCQDCEFHMGHDKKEQWIHCKKDIKTKKNQNMKKILDKVHVIHYSNNNKKWKVYKSGGKRAIRQFKHRDQAYYFARTICDKVVVHTEDGGVAFTFGFEE